MSNIYHTEPPTQGKVLIKSSYGDIDVELWSKEAPLACRNFIQLALEGYYDNTLVHRVIKGFMVQMGDATGTGTGGSSIYNNKPFKDEVHGRIKFNHRGQLAMASDQPNSNLSQFFITLDKCDWLNGKHTIFGKVTGNTIYNVLRMGEAEVSNIDRPLDPIRILGVEVLWNPFDDLVPRAAAKPELAVEAAPRRESRAVAVKDRKLLSFGGDEDSEDSDGEATTQVRYRSLHEAKAHAGGYQVVSHVVPAAPAAESAPPPSSQPPRAPASRKHSSTAPPLVEDTSNAGTTSEDVLAELRRAQSSAGHEERSAEFQSLKAQLLKTRRAVNVLTGAAAEQWREEAAQKTLLTPLEQRRQKFKKRKQDHGDRAEETLQRLQAFTATLRAKKDAAAASTSAPPREVESYHGQVLDRGDAEGSDAEGAGEGGERDWFVGKLKFARHVDDAYRFKDMLGRHEAPDDGYETFDPRHPRRAER